MRQSLENGVSRSRCYNRFLDEFQSRETARLLIRREVIGEVEMAGARKFGEIAVELGYCTEEQISHTLELITDFGLDVRIGKLLELGLLTDEQVAHILEVQQTEAAASK